MNRNVSCLISRYKPFTPQEETDKQALLAMLSSGVSLFGREFPSHFTSSAWIVDSRGENVLAVWHNLYKSWSWTGGHMDGSCDFLDTAIREAREETGIHTLEALMTDPFSLEILPVNGHVRRGKYVPSHLHLNLTFLLRGDEREPLRPKADENRSVRWFAPDAFLRACSEPWMNEWVYEKLIQKTRQVLPVFFESCAGITAPEQE